jgi:hypothetical protein
MKERLAPRGGIVAEDGPKGKARSISAAYGATVLGA